MRLVTSGRAFTFIEPPSDDSVGVNDNVWFGRVDCFGASSDLDAAWLPRWTHFIDNNGSALSANDIAEFLALGEVAPADLDGLLVRT